MNLVWHIVRKDFRRLWLPLALWLLLVLGHVSLLFFWDGPMGTNPDALTGKRYFVNTCGGIVMAVGFILAAWLVMEDNLASSTAFWRTRPLGGLRLLAAKSLGALLMFSVLPVLVLVPVWLACGFSVRQLAHAAMELALPQALLSLGAFALGAITESSGQFLVRLLGGSIVLPAYLAWVISQGGHVNEASATRSILVAVLSLATPLAMTAHQFLSRRTARTWTLFVLGLALLWVGGCWWPWDLTGWLRSTPAPNSAGMAGVDITAGALKANRLQSFGSRVPVAIDGKVSGLAPGTHVRVDSVQTYFLGGAEGRGPRLTGVAANAEPSTETIRQAAGLAGSAPNEAAWTATAIENSSTLGDPRPRKAVVKATVLHGAPLGEVPLRAGAELRVGSSYLRVHSVDPVDNGLSVVLDERDAWLTADADIYSHSNVPALRHIRPVADGFLVVNRASGTDVVPVVEDVGTMMADSIMVGRRHLFIPLSANASDEWLKQAVLVKVRFTPGDRIEQAVAGELVPVGR